MATKMSPSKDTTLFAGSALFALPVIARMDRGIRDLSVNYGLKGKLRLAYICEPNAQGQLGWTYQLWHLDQTTKPLVTITNKSFGGVNKFLNECGRVIVKLYGQMDTKQRKTA